MMCYKDMTFCSDRGCKFFTERCHRALTENRKRAAVEWWGKEDAPISIFSDRLDCYKEKETIYDQVY